MRSSVFGLALLSLSGCMEQSFVSDPPHELATPETTGQSQTVGAAAPILRIDPESHDFGSPMIGCELVQTFQLHNDGDADLVVDGLAFAAGSDELLFDNPHALPLTVAPGDHAAVSVSYLGLDTVEEFAELIASSNDPVRPEASATVRGAAKSAGPVLDVFEQPLESRSDILVVVDNSGSMDQEQNSLTSNFQTFIDAVVGADADYHLAVITTDDPSFQGPMITPATPDPVGEFDRQASVGTGGSGDERPLQMILEATQPGADAAPGGTFFRDEAMLAIIIVTDEPDEFSATTPVAVVDYLVGLKADDASLVRVHTIGGDVPVPACGSASQASVPLDVVSALSGGLFASVCSNWGASLTAVAAASVSLLDRFALSEEPFLPSLTVTVDGVATTAGWTWDAATASVVFDAAAVPEPGATIEIAYEPLPDCGP